MSTFHLVLPSGRVVSFNQDTISIGSDPSSDLVIDDRSVSGHHATVERHPQGWQVSDQASAEGTFVNGMRVTERLLRPGQELRLGAAVLRVAQGPGGSHGPVARSKPADDLAALRMATGETGETPPGAHQTAAAARLGVWPDAAAEEVLDRYERMCREMQARLEGAASPTDAAAVEEELRGIRAACVALLRRGRS
jgi:predicted component of type VI protein secretion system